jgi:LAO/AO transport system kinase
LRAGDRGTLARAITLVESTHPRHQREAQALLNAILPNTGGATRVGITGPPGVGKSTFIEALGTLLTSRGHKVAVLAVDPSSQRTGGSILGDKTRMPRLALDANAFVRPSPSSGTLGGVARRSREALLLCEAAGFDVVLVETVGAGQSETAVADMVDVFIVLTLPGAGDELQGIKKGVLELADIVAVNKADGDNVERAQRATSDLSAALRILSPADPQWPVPVLAISALTGEGIEALWVAAEKHRHLNLDSGRRDARRRLQNRRWMWALVEERVLESFRQHPEVRALLPSLEAEVIDGALSPAAAAQRLLDAYQARSRANKP